MFLRCLPLLLISCLVLSAEALHPTAYSMPNGELGAGGLLYRDDIYSGSGDAKQDKAPLADGLGQLSDGTTPCTDDPATDCAKGAGYDWVAWRNDPTITFVFGQRCDFRMVRLFTANWPDGAVRLWKTATVSVSDDGLNFRDFTVRTVTPEEAANRKARYMDIPLRGSARFVRIHLIRADASSWIAIGEAQFDGRISRDQNPPSKPR